MMWTRRAAIALTVGGGSASLRREAGLRRGQLFFDAALRRAGIRLQDLARASIS